MHNISRTRRLVVIALLSALSAVLMVFPTIPMFYGVMKLDFSVVVILIGMILMGLPSAFAILIIRSIVKVLLFNGGANDWIGIPMNIVAMGLFITAIWLFTHKAPKLKLTQFILGSIVGTVVLTVVMALLNWVYAIPLYEIFANFKLSSMGMDIKQWVVAIVLPFNLIQGAVLSLVTGIVLFPMLGYLEKQKQQL